MTDVIVIILLIIIVALVFKRFDNTVIFLGLTDVFLRLFHFIGDKAGIKSFNHFINRYLPTSVLSVVESHAEGIIYTILLWLYIVIMLLFVFYVLRMLFHRIH